MFQPVFQAGMQAEAGRMIASSAGSCPALALNKWVRDGAAVEAAGVLARICMSWNRPQAARGGGMCRGCVSSDFVSFTPQFYF